MELNDILKIGAVSEVSGRVIKAGVYSEKNSEFMYYDGSILKNVGIGSFVLIRKGFDNIIGKVDGEYSKENNKGVDSSFVQKGTEFNRVIGISVLGSLKNGIFKHGLTELPLIGNYVYILDEKIVAQIFAKKIEGQTIELGTLIGYDYPFQLNIQDIMTSHIGIFGNTGSGKSNTLAKLLYEVIEKYKNNEPFKQNAKFLLIDFNGEYGKVFPKSKNYHLMTSKTKDKYPLLFENIFNIEFWNIVLESTEKTQKPFVGRAIDLFKKIVNETFTITKTDLANLIVKTQGKFNDLRYTFEDIFDALGEKSKLANLDEKYFYNGMGKQIGKTIGSNYVFNITPSIVYSDLFGSEDDNISMEIIHRLNYFEKFEFSIKYQYAQDIGRNYITKEHISPLVARARHRCSDLSKLFSVLNEKEYKETKTDVIEIVSVDSLRIELKKLIPMIICKTNYDLQKNKKYKGQITSTLHIVVDEAHNILSTMSTRESEEWKDYRIESFEEIIKEGRKFGTFLIIASQRPSDISDTIISQLHNYFIHRLVNDEDIRKIYKTVAFADKETNDMIPILPAGGCVFAGLASNFPVLAQINMLAENRPKSENVSIADVWGEI